MILILFNGWFLFWYTSNNFLLVQDYTWSIYWIMGKIFL